MSEALCLLGDLTGTRVEDGQSLNYSFAGIVHTQCCHGSGKLVAQTAKLSNCPDFFIGITITAREE